MSCVVDNLVFGPMSKNAIKDIREATKRANWLSTALAASVLGDIFIKNGPTGVSYKIFTTDFELLGQAMASTTIVLKKRIRDTAADLVLFNSSSLTGPENKFWRCVYDEAS